MALNPLLKQLVTQSAAKYKGGTAKSIKPKEGRNVYRIIAPGAWQGEAVDPGVNQKFERELGVHWIKPDLNAKPVAVVGSEEIVYGRISALATAIDMAIANAYDEDSKKLYEEWKARKSIILNVVDRSDNSVGVLEISPTTFSKIMDQVVLYDDNGIDILNHQNGMDIVITKTGKGLNTSYDVAVVPLPPGKTFPPVTKEQVAQATDLDQWIVSNFFRGEEQKALNAVAQIAGIAIPQIGHAPATPVAALTSAGASVAGAQVQTASAPPPAAPPVQPVMSQADMEAEVRRQVAERMAQQQQQAAAAAASVMAAPPVAPVVTPDTSMGDLSQDEQDALLAELNAIGGA